MDVLSVAAVPTSCGQPNGQVTINCGRNKAHSVQHRQSDIPDHNIFTGLPAGTYTLLARDSAGCTVSRPVA